MCAPVVSAPPADTDTDTDAVAARRASLLVALRDEGDVKHVESVTALLEILLCRRHAVVQWSVLANVTAAAMTIEFTTPSPPSLQYDTLMHTELQDAARLVSVTLSKGNLAITVWRPSWIMHNDVSRLIRPSDTPVFRKLEKLPYPPIIHKPEQRAFDTIIRTLSNTSATQLLPSAAIVHREPAPVLRLSNFESIDFAVVEALADRHRACIDHAYAETNASDTAVYFVLRRGAAASTQSKNRKRTEPDTTFGAGRDAPPSRDTVRPRHE